MNKIMIVLQKAGTFARQGNLAFKFQDFDFKKNIGEKYKKNYLRKSALFAGNYNKREVILWFAGKY